MKVASRQFCSSLLQNWYLNTHSSHTPGRLCNAVFESYLSWPRTAWLRLTDDEGFAASIWEGHWRTEIAVLRSSHLARWGRLQHGLSFAPIYVQPAFSF